MRRRRWDLASGLAFLAMATPPQLSTTSAFLCPTAPKGFRIPNSNAHRRLSAATLPSEGRWEALARLLEEAQADDQAEGSVGISSRRVDQQIVSHLDQLKADTLIHSWNSTRLSQYRVTKSELRVYTKMEDIETALGFTSTPVVERIETGMAIIMAFTIGSSILALDKFPGPDIVRWFATAFLVSTPFLYIILGLSLPDTLIQTIDSILFVANREYKERLYRHEAAHMLVGYMCGLPVLDYDVGARLNAVQFARAFQRGEDEEDMMSSPMEGPLPRELALKQQQEQQHTDPQLFTDDDMNKLIVVSLAGVVSEYIRFGCAEGGYKDMMQLQVLMDLQNPMMTQREAEEQVNWGALMAYSILKSNEEALEALMEALAREASVVECIRIIERETAARSSK